MNKKSLFISIIIFLTMTFIGAYVVAGALVDPSYIKAILRKDKNVTVSDSAEIGRCNSREKIEGLEESQDPVLAKLPEYQEICNSFVTEKMMLFTDMPKDDIVAAISAKKLAVRLKDFSKYGITPIVVIEPQSDWGLIDFQEFNTGFYDSWIETYFRVLKGEGVTDEELGIWVPFPEANIPTWNRAGSTPKDFALGVNRYGKIMKKYFPGAHVSVLLNSATYDNEDYDWLYGEFISLKPYVEYLDGSIVSSIGLQGFPWVAKATSASNDLTDPAEFLNYRILKEAAEIIGVKKVWFNTGTFSAKYVNGGIDRVDVSYQDRLVILENILNEAVLIKNQGYEVMVNIFAEDKSNTSEQTNWSYFGSNEEKIILKDFVHNLNRKGIVLSLFDRNS